MKVHGLLLKMEHWQEYGPLQQKIRIVESRYGQNPDVLRMV